MKGKLLLLLFGACAQGFLLSAVWAQNALLSEWYVDNGKRAVREQRFDEAEEHYLTALREAPGPNQRLADSIVSLAHLYVAQGNPKAAERLLERALAIQERNLGPGHPAVADNLNHLGHLYHEQKKYKKAERLHTQALAIQEKLAPGSVDVPCPAG